MKRRIRTLSLSVFFSSFGPLITFYAIFQTTSSTQVADFVRRSAELMVLILALVAFQKSSSEGRLTKVYTYSVAVVFVVSGSVILFLAVRDFLNSVAPTGNIFYGLFVAGLGVFFNGFFWLRYRAFDQEESHKVLSGQKRLYQAKTMVDVSVVFSLIMVRVLAGVSMAFYVDKVVAMVIAFYLIVRGLLGVVSLRKEV